MIKAVVFDLDHTLFDRHATLAALVPELRRSFDVNKALSDEEIARLWIYADDNFVYDGWQYIFSYLTENGVFEKPPVFEDYRKFVFCSFRNVAIPFSYTQKMLLQLRNNGYKIGLITNGYHELQMKKLKLLGLTDAFDKIIISGDVMTDKPDREIFFMMCEKLGLRPAETVYVGDNPKNDIDGARNAGMHTIWVRSTGVWQYQIEPAKYCVATVEEVPEAVEIIQLQETTL